MLRELLRKLITLTLFLSVASIALSQTANNSAFKPDDAHNKLEVISKQVSKDERSKAVLNNAINDLTRLKKTAGECVSKGEAKLEELKKQIAEITEIKKPDTPLTADHIYLQQKEKLLANQIAECRLVVLRSQEVISKFTKQRRSLVATQLLKAGPNIWQEIKALPTVLSTSIKKINFDTFYDNSGLKSLWGVHSFALIFLFVGGYWLVRTLKNLMASGIKNLQPQQLSERVSLALMCTVNKYIYVLTMMSLVIIFLSVISLEVKPVPYVLKLAQGVLSYFIFLSIIELFFLPPIPAEGLTTLAKKMARKLVGRLKAFGIVGVIAFATYSIAADQPLPEDALNILHTLFIMLFTVILLSVVWIINQIPKLVYQHRIVRFVVSMLMTIGLLACIAAELLGYFHLAEFLLRGVALTLALGFATWFGHKLLMAIFDSFYGTRYSWQKRFRFRLGLKKPQPLPELNLLRVLLDLVLWTVAVIVFLQVWGLSETDLRYILGYLIEGFRLGNLTVSPLRIISSLILFVGLVLLTRVIKGYIIHRHVQYAERGANEAIAAITGYVGFSFALVFAMLLAGVNFTGLAIIAGALSVGIGFGLQSIVNNFVSGLILLIERPIKPGDRIIVGNTEGYVKSVSIRSTRIHTMERADVIVPNAELVSTQVTNKMFNNTFGRISVFVGVAYGSDVELVRKVLTDIAYEHSEVVKDESLAKLPQAIFRQYDESNLKFEIRCIIKNIDMHRRVKSDLNFSIYSEFQKHGIEIPFPQRDLHIKHWPKFPDQG